MNFGREKKFNHLSFESTNTPSLPRRRPRRVLPIEIVQVARGEEARQGREAVDATPTAGGQREAPLRLLLQILDWQGASHGFLEAYVDN